LDIDSDPIDINILDMGVDVREVRTQLQKIDLTNEIPLFSKMRSVSAGLRISKVSKNESESGTMTVASFPRGYNPDLSQPLLT